jgi:hypothetical protein
MPMLQEYNFVYKIILIVLSVLMQVDRPEVSGLLLHNLGLRLVFQVTQVRFAIRQAAIPLLVLGY